MREIIFRGKRKDNGEWVMSGNLIHAYDNGKHSYYIPVYNDKFGTVEDEYGNFLSIEYGTFYKVDPATVGQFTGLYDNGTKIFEGDIVQYADIYDYNCYLESLENEEAYEGCDYSDIWTVDEVVFCNAIGYPAFDLNSHDFETNGLSELIESGAWHYEVIGNIHDNPELLEGEAVGRRNGMREKLTDLIIEAKRTDPETGSFTEYLADFLIENGVVIPVRCGECRH